MKKKKKPEAESRTQFWLLASRLILMHPCFRKELCIKIGYPVYQI